MSRQRGCNDSTNVRLQLFMCLKTGEYKSVDIVVIGGTQARAAGKVRAWLRRYAAPRRYSVSLDKDGEHITIRRMHDRGSVDYEFRKAQDLAQYRADKLRESLPSNEWSDLL
jgi:hypothetical protein